jgi:hypothetical protein
MSTEFAFAPEIRLMDGSVIRNREDALFFLRAQEARPGVDDRDELLHAIERADEPSAIAHAGRRFRDWLRQLEILDERP